MNELIINKVEDGYKACILEENRVCEFYSECDDETNAIGNIYLGKIVNVIDGMQAAFIDIGTEKNAFIALKDILPKIDITKEDEVDYSIKISDVVKTGDKLLVQIKKMSVGEKGPRVSTHVTLPGNYIVIMPNTDILTISQKINDNSERSRLKNIVQGVLPENYGAIVRTDAVNVSKELIEADICDLIGLWECLYAKYLKSDNIDILHDEHEFLSKISRELITKRINKIYFNDENVMKQINKTLRTKGLCKDIDTEMITSSNVFVEFGIEGQIANIGARKCWLKTGGYIIIDKTEALTAIDVNSGKHLGKVDMEETAFEVNKEAAYEIMRQIRLKDIGGIIIIDYINLVNPYNQAEILKIMEEEAKKDKTKVDIKGYTKLNLVELTRKRVNI